MRALLLGFVGAVRVSTLDGAAKCLDGSSAIYYADMTGSKDWIIYLMGGGMCGFEKSCLERRLTPLGTAKAWPKDIDFGTEGIDLGIASKFLGKMPFPNLVSANATTNPHFHGFNRVFVPYCSGDLWSGRQVPTWDNVGLTFAGAHIAEGVREALPIAEGSRVLFTGDSAGGVGAIYHADSFASAFRQKGVRVVAAPRGGFIFPQVLYPGRDAHKPSEPATHISMNLKWWNGTWVQTPRCVEEHGSEHCSWPASLVGYLNTAVFAIEALTDKVVTSAPFGSLAPKGEDTAEKTAFLNAWAKNMTIAFQNLKPKDGLFAPACFLHCGFFHTAPLIQGKGFDDALAAWYYGTSEVPSRLMDTCEPTYPSCNPTCPSKPSESDLSFRKWVAGVYQAQGSKVIGRLHEALEDVLVV